MTSQSTARAGGSCESESTRSPQRTSPPASSSSPTSASAIAWEPPSAMGQPTTWASAPSSIPNPPVTGVPRSSTEWADNPASNAGARSPSKRRASEVAGRMPTRP